MSMASNEVWLLGLLILLAAVLYSSVGHAGASGYLAVMGLFGLASTIMKPTALVLNVLVATIATVRYARIGLFSWSGLWPFLVASIPLSALGGAVHLPDPLYKPAVGLVLLWAAYRLLRLTDKRSADRDPPAIPLLPAVASGGVIGFLAGLTGTGGGIFLSPLLVFKGWSGTRQSAGISSAFILANSIAGLAGSVASVRYLPPQIGLWALAAVVGGFLGTELASRHLAEALLRRLLALVLVIAGLKLIITGFPRGFIEQLLARLPSRSSD